MAEFSPMMQRYLETKDQIPQDNPYWRMLIQDLPDSYLQKRMWTGDYATLREFIKLLHLLSTKLVLLSE